MNVLLVHAHPEAKSFCAALFEQGSATLRNCGHAVKTSDLYRLEYHPVGGPRIAQRSEFAEGDGFWQREIVTSEEVAARIIRHATHATN